MSLEASSAEALGGNVLPRSLWRGSTLGAAVDIAVVLAPALADGEPALLLPPRWRWGGVQRLTAGCGEGSTKARGRGSEGQRRIWQGWRATGGGEWQRRRR